VPRNLNAWAQCYSEATNVVSTPFHKLTQKILYSSGKHEEDYDRGTSPLTDMEDLEEKIALDILEDKTSAYVRPKDEDFDDHSLQSCPSNPPSTTEHLNPPSVDHLPSPPSTPSTLFPHQKLAPDTLPAVHNIRTSYDPNRPSNRKYPIKSDGDYEWTVKERARASQCQHATNVEDLSGRVS
jgi:hypothetical protein